MMSFRITPRPPLFAFVVERELFALREREPHEEELFQFPPALRQSLQLATYIFFATAFGFGFDYAARNGRLTPRPPRLASAAEREPFAEREREPHEEEASQAPPALRQ